MSYWFLNLKQKVTVLRDGRLNTIPCEIVFQQQLGLDVQMERSKIKICKLF